jgi:glycosyltransferase involved in cell wall biosynthesis
MPHKGVNYLIDAVPDGMQLTVMGMPYHEQFYKDLLSLSTGKQIRFLHDQDDAALVRAYRNAMCVVLPSVYTDMYGGKTDVPELLGQTLLEGMACGLPAICTNVASMPEIVVDGVTGFVVPPNDSRTLAERIVWLRNNPDGARAMGQAGRKRVLEKFVWSQVVKRCLDAYRS